MPTIADLFGTGSGRQIGTTTPLSRGTDVLLPSPDPSVPPPPQGPVVIYRELPGPPGATGAPGPPGAAGATGARGPAADEGFVYQQPQPSAQWLIAHNLNRFPSVTIVDTANDQMNTSINYLDENNIVVTFTAPVAGVAYLN